MLFRAKHVALLGLVTVLLISIYELYLSSSYYQGGLEKLHKVLQARLTYLVTQDINETSIGIPSEEVVQETTIVSSSFGSTATTMASTPSEASYEKITENTTSDPDRTQRPETETSRNKPSKTEEKAEEKEPKRKPSDLDKHEDSERPKKRILLHMPPPIEELDQKQDKNARYLVYICDENRRCGGWGDRQRGLTSAYLLARLTDRQFKIIMSTPCELKSFYVPNKVHWQPLKDELDTKSNISLNAFRDRNFDWAIAKSDFNEVYPQKVVYLKTNKDYYFVLNNNPFYTKTMWRWRDLHDRAVRFRWAWGELMRPTKRLLTQLELLVGPTLLMKRGLTTERLGHSSTVTTDVGNSSLICAHVRLGRNPTIPMDGAVTKFRAEDIPTLFDFMASQEAGGNDCRFFVGTDADHVRRRTRTFFGDKVVGYGGRILHVDRQRDESDGCMGFEEALVEQMLMSVCDVLVVSKSGFSRYAAMVSNSSMGHVYHMHEGKLKLGVEERRKKLQ